MLKIFFYSCIWFLLSLSSTFAAPTKVTKDQTILERIVPTGEKIVTGDDWFSMLDNIFAWAKDGIFGMLMVLSLGVFLFLWIRLVIARGNPEEFKKSMMSMVYAVVGLFLVSAAWAIVKLVSWLNIS